MRKHSRYHSIGQFRDVYKQIQRDTAYEGKDDNDNSIYNWQKLLPTLTFTGSEKLHGTNAAIGFDSEGTWTQSRERILSLESDNAGFARYVEDNLELLTHIRDRIGGSLRWDERSYTAFIVYGEWCGANIQPQVALSKLPKQFIVFGIKVIDYEKESWLSDEVVVRLLKEYVPTVFDFNRYTLEIDFNNPDEAINKMVEITNEVELRSPIGIAHGVDGIGEGVVWKCGKYIFKVKGKLHSASHVKVLVAIDIEKVRNVQECVEKIVTSNRLMQGVDELISSGINLDHKAIGPFIKWVKDDCIKEELDTITGSDLIIEDVVKSISFKSKDYFIKEVLQKL